MPTLLSRPRWFSTMSFKSTQVVGHCAKTGVAKVTTAATATTAAMRITRIRRIQACRSTFAPHVQVRLYLNTDTLEPVRLCISSGGSQCARHGPESANRLNPSNVARVRRREPRSHSAGATCARCAGGSAIVPTGGWRRPRRHCAEAARFADTTPMQSAAPLPTRLLCHTAGNRRTKIHNVIQYD